MPSGLFLRGLIGLAALQTAAGFVTDAYFYGQSPPVYPSPNGTGLGDWAASYQKAQALVEQLTLDEKVNLTGGYTATTGCSGSIPPIPRVGFPGLCLNDAGNGVRGTDFVSGWPSGISVGASWNRNLSRYRGLGMGGEFRTKGVNMALGPVVGPLGRTAEGGRNWEGFSNDPYLCGALAYETIEGIQETGVITSVKHFIAYEQETNRNPSGNVSSVSSNLDDKTMHELYLWPFQDAIRAGSGNVMCSYNRVNNSYACGNSKTLNGLLKTELGFQGFVVSDWSGQHAGVATAEAGLDMTMPSGAEYWGDNLALAVTNGSLPVARVDDMATRILATWYQMGQDAADFPVPGVGMTTDYTAPHEAVIATDPAFASVLLDGAIEGHVLVKNTGNALPLRAPKLISLFGYSAAAPAVYTVGRSGWDTGALSLNAGQLTAANSDIAGTGLAIRQIAANGTLTSGGGSGANENAYLSSPFEALGARARRDGSFLYWDFVDGAPTVNPASDVCIVDGNAFATEGEDRGGLHDDFTDGLVLNVAAACNNTVVVLQNAGVRLVDQFADHPNVTAIIFAHLPGQDSGAALAALLYGDANPSGKLPYTVPRNESAYPSGQLAPVSPNTTGPFVDFPQSDFTEGVYIDYRGFDARNVTPRYEFGFGLSYTTFAFAGLESQVGVSPNGSATAFSAYPTQVVLPGGQADLWDVLATASATVTNTGAVAGAEVAQLYVGIPGGPVRQLRGFEKVVLEPGAAAQVQFNLTRRDLSTWDVVAQKWKLQSGTYQIYVGSSSRDLPLQGSLTI